MSYEIDYNDQQFQQVEADKNAAMAQTNQAYDSMINDTKQQYQQQIEATENWGKTQQQLQQERTDFTLEQIQQQKGAAAALKGFAWKLPDIAQTDCGTGGR